MSDLFPTSVIALGSLSASDERGLYLNNRAGWLAYVAPTYAQKLLRGGAESIRAAWHVIERDYKAALWRSLTPDEQATWRAALVEETEATEA